MPRQSGRSLLIKIEQTPGGGTFLTLGMLTAKDFTINRNEISADNSDTPDDWSEVDGGIRSMSVNGTLFYDAGAASQILEGVVRDDASDGKANFQVVDPGAGTYEGAFLVTTFSKSGSPEGPVEASFGLRSDGKPAFTPE